MFVLEILSQQCMQYYAILIPHANMEHGVWMQAQIQVPTLVQSEASMGSFCAKTCVKRGVSFSRTFKNKNCNFYVKDSSWN